MKRSRAVQAFLVISAATALSNCGERHEASRRCVDESGNFTDDRNCSAAPGSTGKHHYTWVYAPTGATNKPEENAPAAASKSAAAAGTERGVIGAEGAAHASEGGHAGGAGAGE